MVAKSPWHPSIRREHALAAQAAANGVGVDFIEAPSDIRGLRGRGRRRWISELHRPGRGRAAEVATHRRSTLLPGHRGPLAARIDNRLLARSIRELGTPCGAAVVVNVPWQWDATAGVGGRRVFDAADDWDLLLSGRRPHVRELYRRIAAEADAVIVANANLAALFPGRDVCLVPNGTENTLVAEPVRRPRDPRGLVYVGTFSERFDVDLAGRVLEALPDRHLDLYGECRYAGHGAEPAGEFRDLLNRFGDRVRWHGVLPRPALAGVLDAAGVALIPHRARYCRGQSSMKFLDYASRGLPVVSTRWETGIERQAPPGVWFADDAGGFADGVRQAAAVGAATGHEAVNWARAQTWDRRWPRWSAAVFGTSPS